MVGVIHQGSVPVQFEVAVIGRHPHDLLAFHQLLPFTPEGDQVLDGGDLQPVLLAEGHQLGLARHRTVLVQDLANHPGGLQTGQAGEVYRGLGMAGTPQNAAVLCLKREHMPRLNEVLRRCPRVDEHANGGCAVGRADPRGHSAGGIHGNGKGRLLTFAILKDHALEAQLFRPFVGDRGADEPAPVGDHKIDRRRGYHFRGHQEISLVFTPGVVGDDHHFAGAKVGQHFFDRIKLHAHELP